jgi:hypothetical protein
MGDETNEGLIGASFVPGGRGLLTAAGLRSTENYRLPADRDLLMAASVLA